MQFCVMPKTTGISTTSNVILLFLVLVVLIYHLYLFLQICSRDIYMFPVFAAVKVFDGAKCIFNWFTLCGANSDLSDLLYTLIHGCFSNKR